MRARVSARILYWHLDLHQRFADCYRYDSNVATSIGQRSATQTSGLSFAEWMILDAPDM
jgi:hypothetical protein